ncbi:probable disease resistance RPP8-like protein 2 [Camellia sinensis]|uniref:probable disease resistance RPP8-like protein 2 n=1 Tax=Camellia sinensis TaxID=4442 RepID=UPI0010359E70|nr:probable disease resistance RPP8-like protein 2 [Camellia sinensis]
MDVAKRYLGALTQRCMVEVHVEIYTQRINYCRIHDLMLDLCLSKAKMNDFLAIIHLQCETDLDDCFSTTSTTTTPKIHKLAIHLSRDVKRVVLPDLETTKQLRSILLYDPRIHLWPLTNVNRSSIELNSHVKYFKLLRNLDLEGFKFDKMSVESIGLEMVPEGLRFIVTLQRFTIKDMNENFNNKLRRVYGEEGEDFYKVRHVSSLNIIR